MRVSLTLLVVGALLLAVGVGLAVGTLAGLWVGVGVALALAGVLLIAGGMWVVPVRPPSPAPSSERPIHGVLS